MAALANLESREVRDYSNPLEWKHFCLILAGCVCVFTADDESNFSSEDEEENGGGDSSPLFEFVRNLLARWADHHKKAVFGKGVKGIIKDIYGLKTERL